MTALLKYKLFDLVRVLKNADGRDAVDRICLITNTYQYEPTYQYQLTHIDSEDYSWFENNKIIYDGKTVWTKRMREEYDFLWRTQNLWTGIYPEECLELANQIEYDGSWE